jgi:hypothetical protein
VLVDHRSASERKEAKKNCSRHVQKHSSKVTLNIPFVGRSGLSKKLQEDVKRLLARSGKLNESQELPTVVSACKCAWHANQATASTFERAIRQL